jgi:predicted metalloenzyme YecM
MKSMKEQLKEIPNFVSRLITGLQKVGIDVDELYMDHLCYRVETTQEYKLRYEELQIIATLLTEELIGGRPIATFKLHKGIHIALSNRIVECIELPMPKPSTFYCSGWEHAEFVLNESESLQDFAKRHPTIDWDYSGLDKSCNQDIRVELDSNSSTKMNVKFHKLSLEKVIELESN